MIVTPKEMKALAAIESLVKMKIEWIDGEPSTENLASADFSERRERGRRGRGKPGEREERKEAAPRAQQQQLPQQQPPQPQADVRPFKGNSPRRRDKDSSVSRYHRELLPPATSAPVIGLGEHVPEFLKRPVRAAS
jgi:hypothetical protein